MRGSRMFARSREGLVRLWATFTGMRSDHDLEQELTHHLEVAEEALRRQGHSPQAAARLARVQSGGPTLALEILRDQRGVLPLGSFWLDVKLGVRMLRKYWGLTLVGGLAMTVTIGIGAAVFTVLDGAIGDTTLPLEEGDRVVAIQPWDPATRTEQATPLRDFERWQEELRSVEDVSAYRNVERNLITKDGPIGPISIAEITAAGFGLARVEPLLGRSLLEEDGRSGATPVVVIGYDVWQSRFSADPAVVGQTVQLSGIFHAVVGVMPEGFAFPVNHSYWTPLGADSLNNPLTQNATVFVFARLAPGGTIEGADAEVATIGLLPTDETPVPGQQLRARIVPYTIGVIGGTDRWLLNVVFFVVALLLIPPCANIAILLYARNVTRQQEFAARYVLGASRSRIVGQLLVEALVLATVAAGVGLLVGRQLVWQAQGIMEGVSGTSLPFWMDFSISFDTVLFVAGLAVVAALMAGGVPALRATGRGKQSGLHALGNRTAPRLGMTWTALVVLQVALSLTALPSAVEMSWGNLRPGILGPGFAAERYLTAQLAMDQETSQAAGVDIDERPLAARFRDIQTEIVRQLESQPGIVGVTLSANVPGGEEPYANVEVEEAGGVRSDVDPASFNQVDDAFFIVYGVRLLTGRAFEAGEFEAGRNVVIVSRTFVERLGGDGNPLGRRVRYASRSRGGSVAEPGPWYEIVGVVDDFPANKPRSRVYHPMGSRVATGSETGAEEERIRPVSLALHAGTGGPDSSANMAGKLREVAATVDPALRVERFRFLDGVLGQQEANNSMVAYALAVVMGIVVLFSVAGIYTLMAFTVSQRRREIGIRSALGAQPSRLILGIFRSALGPVVTGAALGGLAAILLDFYLPIDQMGGRNVPGILPGAVAFIILVGLLALAGPALRALHVDPTEALRDG